MNLEWLSNVQPVLTAIGTILSIATLGFLVNLARLISDAHKEREAVLEERLKSFKDDLDRTEKWHGREKEVLSKENEHLKSTLERALSESDISVQAFVAGDISSVLNRMKDELRTEIQQITHRMQVVERDVEIAPTAEWHLTLAQGLVAGKQWAEAAVQFDLYVKTEPLNWEIQFARAVSHANSRLGSESNIAALRAYNEAIALMPVNLEQNLREQNLRARLFTYRAAVLKRLKRLDEAEADLQISEPLATWRYESADTQYNLAAVYALQMNRQKLIETVTRLRDHYPEKMPALHAHLDDYFSMYRRDPEFLEIIGVPVR